MSSEGGGLTIATYNVHGWIGRDAIADHERTMEAVARLEADVVALQEVFVPVDVDPQSERRDIEKVTGMSVCFGPNLVHSGRSYGNALLTSLEIAETNEWDISVPEREPRGALEVRLVEGELRLRVLATHLGTGLEERDTQLTRLLEIVDRDPRIPTVLLGDLNEWRPWSRRFAALLRRFEPGRAAPSFPVAAPLFSLDRILVRNARVVSPPRAVVSPLTRVASDHLPLRAEMAF
ncbi:MAG: endonuclease/exonuclease/phosphatase family protein [Polyangia bacterium]